MHTAASLAEVLNWVGVQGLTQHITVEVDVGERLTRGVDEGDTFELGEGLGLIKHIPPCTFSKLQP